MRTTRTGYIVLLVGISASIALSAVSAVLTELQFYQLTNQLSYIKLEMKRRPASDAAAMFSRELVRSEHEIDRIAERAQSELSLGRKQLRNDIECGKAAEIAHRVLSKEILKGY